MADIYDLPIKRVMCKSCGLTFAVLPDFIKKFCRYGKDVIRYVLTAVIKKTFEEVAEEICLDYEMDIAVRTLCFWKSKYQLSLL